MVVSVVTRHTTQVAAGRGFPSGHLKYPKRQPTAHTKVTFVQDGTDVSVSGRESKRKACSRSSSDLEQIKITQPVVGSLVIHETDLLHSIVVACTMKRSHKSRVVTRYPTATEFNKLYACWPRVELNENS
ncbi:hypothetical protein CBL_04285 [Carabus blaptoides fortunei]